MKKRLLVSNFDSSYQKLLNSVTLEIQYGIAAAKKMLEYARLQTYWKVGKHIDEYAGEEVNCERRTANGKQKAKNSKRGAVNSNQLFTDHSLQFTKKRHEILSQKFYQQFSKQLMKDSKIEMGVDVLKQSVKFYQYYPIFPKNSTLSFSHYRELMAIGDASKRLCLEKKAIKHSLSTKELRRQVVCFNAADQAAVKVVRGKLIYERGRPYVYRICEAEDMNDEKIIAIDCGFGMCHDIPESSTQKLASGQVVYSKKKENTYYVITDNKIRGQNYTYLAKVLKVVDGDTLDVRIDVGFKMKMMRARVRLRGINAPEMSHPKGVTSKKFLLNYLSQCPKIVVRTTKASGEAAGDAKGMFGRWLVDVFAFPGCNDAATIAAEGEYVNQVLVDKGFAEIYK